MKTAIIFFSKTGFTKKYVDWIYEEIECDVFPLAQAKKMDFQGYNRLIFASWLHAGMIQKLKFFKKLHFYGEKIVLVTGATPIAAPTVEATLANNFKDESKKYKTFYFQGGLDYDTMCFGDRVIMKTLCRFLKGKGGDASEMYKTIYHSFDASSKEALAPLLDYLKG